MLALDYVNVLVECLIEQTTENSKPHTIWCALYTIHTHTNTSRVRIAIAYAVHYNKHEHLNQNE